MKEKRLLRLERVDGAFAITVDGDPLDGIHEATIDVSPNNAYRPRLIVTAIEFEAEVSPVLPTAQIEPGVER